MKNYRLSAASQDDLWKIKSYSRAMWGERQTRSYLAAIEAALEQLVTSPELGKKRDELIIAVCRKRLFSLTLEKPHSGLQGCNPVSISRSNTNRS